MAGGLLRAALRAGNVRQVLSASLAASRRARGVREMNRSLAAGGGGRALGLGGDRSNYGASDYLMRRGRPGKFEPYDAVYEDLPSYSSPTAGGGFGRVSRFPDGRRVMFPSAQSGGALSPFEGVRPLPAGSRMTTRDQDELKRSLMDRRMMDDIDVDMEEVEGIVREQEFLKALNRRRAKEWEQFQFGRSLGRDYPGVRTSRFGDMEAAGRDWFGDGYSLRSAGRPGFMGEPDLRPYGRFNVSGPRSIGSRNVFPYPVDDVPWDPFI